MVRRCGAALPTPQPRRSWSITAFLNLQWRAEGVEAELLWLHVFYLRVVAGGMLLIDRSSCAAVG